MTLTRRKLIFGTGAMALCPSVPVCADTSTQVLTGFAFGGTWRLVVPASADPIIARYAVEATAARIDAAMSPWRTDSEISNFNNSLKTGWHAISADIHAVVTEALAVSRLTTGAFDPTVGPLVARFGFGPIKGISGHLDALELGEPGLRKSRTGLTLDLCGIAKGYALDLTGRALRVSGIQNALLEMGGEVLALGMHPTGRTWQVAIEQPGTGPFEVQRIVAPGRFALATSGSVPQGYDGPHGTVSHLIDPQTGRPAQGALASVSVLAPTGCRADALATALTVLGPQDGPALARQMGIAALFLTRTEVGFDEIMTAGFADHVLA